MALIIKGGEIPVDCLGCDEMVMLSLCPIHLNEPLKYCNGTRHPDCPIIGEIPDKHGDLIDEDEFRQVIYREIRNHRKDEPITMILKGILWEMDNAPVIVEATE